MSIPERAGWYDDPKTEGQERYWDGTGWTHDRKIVLAPRLLACRSAP